MSNNLQVTKRNKPHKGEFAYLNIFTMRFMGDTFDQIAEKTGYNSSYLRRLFMQGGKLHQPWKEFQTIAKENSLDEAETILFGKLPAVVKTLTDTAQLPFSMEGVIAGKTVMEYAIGKPLERVAVDANVNITTAVLVERVTLRLKQNANTGTGRTISEGVAEES